MTVRTRTDLTMVSLQRRQAFLVRNLSPSLLPSQRILACQHLLPQALSEEDRYDSPLLLIGVLRNERSQTPGHRVAMQSLAIPPHTRHTCAHPWCGELSEHSPGVSSRGRCTQWERSLCPDPDQDTNRSSGSSATEHQGRGSHTEEKRTEKQTH